MFIYFVGAAGTHMLRNACGGLRTHCESGLSLSPSTRCVLRLKLRFSVLAQEPLFTEPSYQPLAIFEQGVTSVRISFFKEMWSSNVLMQQRIFNQLLH